MKCPICDTTFQYNHLNMHMLLKHDNSLKKKYKERVIELPDQNENDLRKAIQWVENKGVKKR